MRMVIRPHAYGRLAAALLDTQDACQRGHVGTGLLRRPAGDHDAFERCRSCALPSRHQMHGCDRVRSIRAVEYSRRMSVPPPTITYVGHATVLIDMDGTRVLTDPVLRDRVAHLVRRVPPPRAEVVADPDVILISHLHLDHLDLPSLRRLGRDRHVIAPPEARSLLERQGFSHVEEAAPGDSFVVGSLPIAVTPANHSGFRPPLGPRGIALGFVVGGSSRVYFPGDTDLFPAMADLAGTIDVALL